MHIRSSVVPIGRMAKFPLTLAVQNIRERSDFYQYTDERQVWRCGYRSYACQLLGFTTAFHELRVYYLHPVNLLQ